ncbi:MAG: hypothetical protein WBD58_00600 [Geitlerinemataceae cyanobacterium]
MGIIAVPAESIAMGSLSLSKKPSIKTTEKLSKVRSGLGKLTQLSSLTMGNLCTIDPDRGLTEKIVFKRWMIPGSKVFRSG